MPIEQGFEKISAFAWGPTMLVLLVGTGVFLTVRLRFVPLRMLGYGIRSAFTKTGEKSSGDITPFAALMTSLAATIGTGNIAGVAAAIAVGGPGAVFWMWVAAVFGIATKYGEAVLAVKYRERGEDGHMRGGPMYALEKGLRSRRLGRFLGIAFAVFTLIASFGIGNMAQAGAVAQAAGAAFGAPPLTAGILLCALCALVILGGIRSVARVASRFVPLMGGLYILCGLVVIALNIGHLGTGLASIFAAAFTGQAATGAFAGASVMAAIRCGVARGVFSNEAGLGSAPIAAAAAKTDSPARQGFVSMTGTFFDTLVVCTVTALVIACTGVWRQADAAGSAQGGAALTVAAFDAALPGAGGYIVSIGLVLFAFSSILGWSYYGERALEYLLQSNRAVTGYRVVFCAAVVLGAAVPLEIVWRFSDTANALMALPNLVCLLCLHRVIESETKAFMNTLKKEKRDKTRQTTAEKSRHR
ncbi:MAG: sodium:alanine symporter family protein [Eubacteriales bacterium]|nr:sodium:alanine symporter family protein [Eubacteriales bacterium]